ncbi:MAG: FAD/NAD(P)-binding protein [Spirochaetota bacterium]
MYEVVIAGGGLHGTFFAHSLLSRGYVTRSQLCIVDPNARLAAVWLRRARRVGMEFLRSPSSHNLDPDYRALRRHAVHKGFARNVHLKPPYARPSTRLFTDQLEHIVESDRLDAVHYRARVTGISRTSSGYSVQTDSGTLHTRQVILALGPGSLMQPPGLQADEQRAGHLFAGTDESIDSEVSPDPYEEAARGGARMAVIGGGISAWQAALRYSELGAGTVSLISPHPIVESLFDSDPCYIGPKCGSTYDLLPPEEKLECLRRARFPGTIPPELAAAAREACDRGAIHSTLCPARRLEHHENQVTVHTSDGAALGPFDSAVFATGLTRSVPYIELISRISRELNLPLHAGGHPVLTSSLEWAPGLFCTGRHGELIIGPQAASIVGAHLAFRRLIPELKTRLENAADARTHPVCD